MTQIVKCLICGKEKEVLDNKQKSFTCCRTRQPIDERTRINKPIDKDNFEEAKNHIEIKEELEIEEEKEFNNPLEQIKEEEVFYCPNCNTQLNAYETPCPNCNYIIEWR